jgi:integrase
MKRLNSRILTSNREKDLRGSTLEPINLDQAVESIRLNPSIVNASEIYLRYKFADKPGSNTYRNAKTSIGKFLNFICGRPFPTKNKGEWLLRMAAVITEWRKHLEEKHGLANGTIAMHDSEIRKLFNWCRKVGVMSYNPFALAGSYKKIRTRQHHTFTFKEYCLMKEKALGHKWYYLVVLGYRTGMAACDMCLLEWEHIDFDKCVIQKIRHKMRGSGLKHQFFVPFEPLGDLHTMLMDMRKESPADQKYVNPYMATSYLKGRHVISGNFIDWLRIACNIVGKGGLHTFRHTFCSILANGGEGDVVIHTKMTGHTDPKMFSRYVEPDLMVMHNTIRNAFAKAENPQTLDAILKGSPELISGGSASNSP